MAPIALRAVGHVTIGMMIHCVRLAIVAAFALTARCTFLEAVIYAWMRKGTSDVMLVARNIVLKHLRRVSSSVPRNAMFAVATLKKGRIAIAVGICVTRRPLMRAAGFMARIRHHVLEVCISVHGQLAQIVRVVQLVVGPAIAITLTAHATFRTVAISVPQNGFMFLRAPMNVPKNVLTFAGMRS